LFIICTRYITVYPSLYRT